jgi:hypothetical protein
VVLEVSEKRSSKADVASSVVGQIDNDPVETLLGSCSKAIIESLFPIKQVSKTNKREQQKMIKG